MLLIGALALSLSNVASGQDRAKRIRNLDAVLTVHSDGTLDVTEELTVWVAGESNEIVRDLSLRDDDARQGPKMLDVQVLAVTDENGLPLRVEEATIDNGWTRRLRIWISGTGNADRHIAIRYRVANAINFVNAGKSTGALDEMRWKVIGNADIPIDSVRARVVLPASAKVARGAVYAGPSRSSTADAATRTNGNEVSITLLRGISPHEAITIEVGWPIGYIHTKPASSLRSRLVAPLLWWPLLIPLIGFIFAYRAWDKIPHQPIAKSAVVRYEPLNGVSPAAHGELVIGEMESRMRLISATMVDLAVRGFLRIEETNPNVLMVLTRDVGTIAPSMLRGDSGTTDWIIHFVRKRHEWKGLMLHEVSLLEALTNAATSDGITKRERVRVSMLGSSYYASLPEIFAWIKFELVSKGYYRKHAVSVRAKWLSYAAVPYLGFRILLDEFAERGWAVYSGNALLWCTILSALIFVVFQSIMPVSRTVDGARAREAALGFKEFLGRVETMPSVEMFERYLPYAMAFGVQDSWTRAFENVYVTAPGWYTSPIVEFSATSFGHRISGLSASAASSTSSSRPKSGD